MTTKKVCNEKFKMKYYFFDSSGLFAEFRPQQHTNEMGEANWDAANEVNEGKACIGGNGNKIISHLTPYEIIKKLLDKDQTESTLRMVCCFMVETQSMIKITISKDILYNASILMDKYKNLESYDAIQLACALEAKKQYNELIFVSNDKMLNNVAKNEGMCVYSLIEKKI